jgi:hypothetical protein
MLMLALSVASCAPKPPDLSARPPNVQRAFVAKDILDQIKVLSETAITANANKRLSDKDTGYVRDFALAATDAVNAYVPGGAVYGTLTGLKTALLDLTTRMSADGQASPDMAGLLRLLQATINGFAPPNPQEFAHAS